VISYEKIHAKWFKNIQSEAMIPCSCKICQNSSILTYFEYSELTQYQKEDIKEINCKNGKIKPVNVSLLLEGVLLPKENTTNSQHIENYFEKGDQVKQKVELNHSGIGDNVARDKTENNNPIIPQEKIEHIEKPIPLYKEWWFISLFVSFIGGGISWITFNSFYWGVGASVLTFLIMFLFNPKRRFLRLGISSLFMASLSLVPISGFIKIPENSFVYGHLQINPSSISYFTLLLVVLSGFLFWLDSREK